MEKCVTFSFRRIVLFAFLPLLTVQSGMSQQWPRKEKDEDHFKRQEWFYSPRAYPRASIPAGARVDAIRQIRQDDLSMRAQHQALRIASPEARSTPAVTMDSANWTSIGPKPSDGGTAFVSAGRVNAIAIDPRDNNVVYIGAAGGGVWKTTDGGANWIPLTDHEASLASGAIVIDPNNPDIVYVGTGEENFTGDSYYGAGILKSTDGGKTWTNIVGPFLRDKIGALAIRPGSSQVLLCTSQFGVWRSADAGQTWALTLSGAAGISVVFDPTNGASAYASLGTYFGSSKNGVYHSSDGGVTWTAVNGTKAAGLPTSVAGRIDIAIAPSAPSTIYAQIGDNITYGLAGIYKTTDGGSTWHPLPVQNPSLWGAQAYFTNAIRVDPRNPDIVWSAALAIYRSLDGGATWVALPQAGPNTLAIHVDFHALAFTPDGDKLYIGNDGGVYSTTDISAGTVNWTSLNDTLAITEFHPGMSLDPSSPRTTLAGAQDNSTQRYDGDLNWHSLTCGDGGYTAIDPAFPALAYGACQKISVLRSLNLAGSATWVLCVLWNRSKRYHAIHCAVGDGPVESADVVLRNLSAVA